MTRLDNKHWLVKGKPFLSTKRLIGLTYYLVKRWLGFDYSFNPPVDSSNIKIDVFMPTIEKDIGMLKMAIDSIRKYSLHKIKKIYIVGPAKSSKLINAASKLGCTFIDEETVLDFKKEDINYFYKGYSRNGWIYKMLLNLSADKVCKSENILILDSDTIFISPQIFVFKNKPLFNLSDEYNEAYYLANERIIGVKHRNSRSFITHYMIFNASALKNMRDYIEKSKGVKWHEAIISNIVRESGSGFADYEIYGDYYTQIYGKPYILNYWSNSSYTIKNKKNLDDIIEKSKNKYRSISLHHYREKF